MTQDSVANVKSCLVAEPVQIAPIAQSQDQFGIVRDQAWIEKRLAGPFTGLPAKEAR